MRGETFVTRKITRALARIKLGLQDYVIATGAQYSVHDFVAAAAELDLNLRWQGSGVDEKAYDAHGRCVVAVDPRCFRPTEVDTLLGDAAKARQKLGWTPRTGFKALVAEMVRADLDAAGRRRPEALPGGKVDVLGRAGAENSPGAGSALWHARSACREQEVP